MLIKIQRLLSTTYIVNRLIVQFDKLQLKHLSGIIKMRKEQKLKLLGQKIIKFYKM